MMFEKAGIYIQIHTTMTSTTMTIAVQWYTIEKYISNRAETNIKTCYSNILHINERINDILYAKE